MLRLLTSPASEPLTATEAKALAGLPASDADESVDVWVRAERKRLDGADGYLGRALITQTWEWLLYGFPNGCGAEWLGPLGVAALCSCPHHPYGIELPLPPLQSVDAISYIGPAGSYLTLDPATYRVIPGDPGYLIPLSSSYWPSLRASYGLGNVVIRFTCGYGDEADSVPEPIKMAMAMRIAKMRHVTQQNLFITNRTVEGVGSTAYAAGGGATSTLNANANELLDPYRVRTGLS